MATPLGNAIQFFKDFGLFDIVLPFLLVFTLVFAILEKTRILGTESDEKTPKKNLNSMVGFVIGLLVVVSNKVVTAINHALPNVILLLTIFIAFLLLVGTFWKSGEKDFVKDHKSLYRFFIFVTLISVILIFLGAIRADTGQSWLDLGWDYVTANWGGAVVSSFIIFGVLILTMWFITKPKSSGSKSEE
ncbi:MAG TPA: hypothetical protein VJJ23_02075 [Candidatus Nanoarchaeia archaeon]|nr:hypothetical protein [Candidatus Nanoarchaeia archaeon]